MTSSEPSVPPPPPSLADVLAPTWPAAPPPPLFATLPTRPVVHDVADVLVGHPGDVRWPPPVAEWVDSRPDAPVGTGAGWVGERLIRVDDQGQLPLRVNGVRHDVLLSSRVTSGTVAIDLIGLSVIVTMPGSGTLIDELFLEPAHEFAPRRRHLAVAKRRRPKSF